MSKKGFTLVELLVVIAIIGILAGITFVTLSSSQDAASDSAIKQEVSQLRAAAQLSFNKSNDFTSVCESASVTKTFDLDDDLEEGDEGENGATNSTYYCHDNATTWVIARKLTGDSEVAGEEWWCIDSTGDSIEINTGTGNSNIDADETNCSDLGEN